MVPQNHIKRHTLDFGAKAHVTFIEHQCEGNKNQYHLSHFNEKTAFHQSLDDHDEDNVTRPFCLFLGM